MMVSEVPNMSNTVGYTNASWTLKADLIHAYVCRLINYMGKSNQDYCVAKVENPNMDPELAMDFSSGYVKRSIHLLPKQGDRKPWKLFNNYFLDFLSLKMGSLQDGAIEFHRAGEFFNSQEDKQLSPKSTAS
jgi:hypothetical protein